MYKSPITIIESTIDSFTQSIIKQKDDAIFAEIQHSFGVDMDKEELIRALKYDRDQYEKGYADGKADAVKRGQWIEKEDPLGDTYYDCSACGESFCFIEGEPDENSYLYCPNCGAKMDGDGNG